MRGPGRLRSVAAWCAAALVCGALMTGYLSMAHSSHAEEVFSASAYRNPSTPAGPVSARQAPPASFTGETTPTEVLPRPSPAPPASRLVFHDDFAGSAVDSSKWIGCFPWAPTGCNNPPNNSLEWFTPSQATVSDGMVHITAAKEPIEGRDAHGNPMTYQYRSANITTAGKFDFTYGYVQFRAQFPLGRGLWSAVWMLPSNGQFPPEFDIMEIQNLVPGKVAEVFHGDAIQQGQDVYGVSGWHTYGLLWEPGSITWYIDDVPKLHVTTDVPSQPMYLLLTLAVGGDWPGPPTADTPFPSSLDVSDVQVWQ